MSIQSIPIFVQVIFFGLLMSAVSFVGIVSYTFKQEKLSDFLSYFIALASGTLMGGAFFHMIPHSLEHLRPLSAMIMVLAGFVLMYALELFVHWHHCQAGQRSMTKSHGVMILLADGIHNFIGGVGVGAGFVMGPSLGVSMWLMALLHEIPQEIGDFAVLLNSGMKKKKALLLNFLSSLTFLLGMIIVYSMNAHIDVSLLIPFAAGNFIYIAASDLIPEIKEHPNVKDAIGHLVAFILGLLVLLIPELIGHHH